MVAWLILECVTIVGAERQPPLVGYTIHSEQGCLNEMVQSV